MVAFALAAISEGQIIKKGYDGSLMPGMVRPALVSCQVYTMRSITVIVETTAITQSTAPIRVVNPPIINKTRRSGRSMKPTLQRGMSDSARALA